MHPLDPYFEGTEHVGKGGRECRPVFDLEISYPAEDKYINLALSPLKYEYLRCVLMRLQLYS
jgi:hypothetical protein